MEGVKAKASWEEIPPAEICIEQSKCTLDTGKVAIMEITEYSLTIDVEKK